MTSLSVKDKRHARSFCSSLDNQEDDWDCNRSLTESEMEDVDERDPLEFVIKNAKYALRRDDSKRWPPVLRDHPEVRPFIEALAALEGPYNRFLEATVVTKEEKRQEKLEAQRVREAWEKQSAQENLERLKRSRMDLLAQVQADIEKEEARLAQLEKKA